VLERIGSIDDVPDGWRAWARRQIERHHNTI
jgi:hypothetical protein